VIFPVGLIGEKGAAAEQVRAGASEHLAFEHLKSYVESAGVMMFLVQPRTWEMA
jgi:hypothetical protein